MEITKDKITDIFCIIDDFCEEYDKDIERMSLKAPDGRRHRKRSCVMNSPEYEISSYFCGRHCQSYRSDSR